MCRLLLFAGTCTRCNEPLAWADLSQQLSCLEAKNADGFGSCRRGVDVDTHAFEQECDACTAADDDEGIAGLEFGEPAYDHHHHDPYHLRPLQPCRQQQQPSSSSSSGASSAAASVASSSERGQRSGKRGGASEEGETIKRKRPRT